MALGANKELVGATGFEPASNPRNVWSAEVLLERKRDAERPAFCIKKAACSASGISMLNYRWLLSSAFVASALHGFCAAAQSSHCTSALGDVEVRGNLDITARCQLTGTDVRGNVTLFSGGSLIARDVRIRGNLEARRADFVAIEDSEIDGNVTLDELVGDNSSIEDTEIDGNASLTSNRSALEILNNEIDGNVQASGNSGGVSISGNSIDGNLECSGNTPAPVGLGNRVDKRSQGQCENLRPQASTPPPTSAPATPPRPLLRLPCHQQPPRRRHRIRRPRRLQSSSPAPGTPHRLRSRCAAHRASVSRSIHPMRTRVRRRRIPPTAT